MGEFEGQLLKDVNPAIEVLYKQPWKTPPGSTESFNGFSERWLNFLDEKMEAAVQVESWRPTVIVTHGKNIALTHSYLEGLNTWDAKMPLPAGYAVIKINQDRSLGLDFYSPTESVIEDI